MLHAPLTLTTAKLDISLLLKSSPSPPLITAAPSQSSLPRSSSVPLSVASQSLPHPAPSQRTSTSSNLSTSSRYGPATPIPSFAQPQRLILPPIIGSSPGYLSVQATQAPLSSHVPAKRPAPSELHHSSSPKKRQSKWSPDEDALIIELRGSGMKWEDISKRLPGRSAISCRLHYQNYLERRSEWDEEKKNRLARLYERSLKPDMWSALAAELGIPWRAAEAMHWQLGEVEMARRAGVTPFSLTSSANSTSTGGIPAPPPPQFAGSSDPYGMPVHHLHQQQAPPYGLEYQPGAFHQPLFPPPPLREEQRPRSATGLPGLAEFERGGPPPPRLGNEQRRETGSQERRMERPR
ncbi:hypothetical protein MMC25_000989 [Agyrium rufum]|nr:hypothetical protein [Agyrium rufum]